MGLDMYLTRGAKVEGCTLREQMATLYNIEAKENGYTLEEWCGMRDNFVREDKEEKVKAVFYPQEVAYWRKANQIHNWFVENVQNGVDDCGSYEVTKEQLTELLNICEKVKAASKLVDGTVANGYRCKNVNGEFVEEPILEEGKIIEDPITAMQLLPTTNGFFFGSTDYDQWYYEDIEDTIEQISRVLDETDFNTEYVWYASSW